MSQIAAVVAWGRGVPPPAAAPAVAAALRAELGAEVGSAARVEGVPGALLGCVAFGPAPDAFREHVAIDETARVAALVDARLDNRARLRSLLGAGADVPDAALVLRGYLAWGDDLPAH